MKCQCLFEIENKLPRTKFCFKPCEAQRQIRKIKKDKLDNKSDTNK